MKVAIFGGTGFIGNALVERLLAHGDHVTVVTRDPSAHHSTRAGVEYAGWLPELGRFDALVNLAGAPIAGKRWSASYKRELAESRVALTRKLVDALAATARKPKVLVNSSAVGYYGDRGEEVLHERSRAGDDFLARLCVDWENAARGAEAHGVRVVLVRTAIVLGPDGGALQPMLPLFKLGLGGPLGSGKAWFPWVQLEDLCAVMLFALDRDDARGPINAAAPESVRQKEFARTLGRVLGRPAFLPAPVLALRIALGEVAHALVASERVEPHVARELGFRFQWPELEPALRRSLAKA
jgi:uncharacterized protein